MRVKARVSLRGIRRAPPRYWKARTKALVLFVPMLALAMLVFLVVNRS